MNFLLRISASPRESTSCIGQVSYKPPALRRVLSICLLTGAMSAAALEPGSRAFYFDAPQPLSGSPFSLRPDADGNLKSRHVLVFFKGGDAASSTALKFATRMEEIFRDAGFTFSGVTVGTYAKAVALAAEAKGKEGRIPITFDRDGSLLKGWMGGAPGLPWAFVVEKDGGVPWCGEVSELDRVLPLVATDKFSLSKQRKIESTHQEMEAAAHFMDVPKQILLSEAGLAIDPTDRACLDVKTRALLVKGDVAGAEAAIDKALEEADSNVYLRRHLLLSKAQLVCMDVTREGRARLTALLAKETPSASADPMTVGMLLNFILDKAQSSMLQPGAVLAAAKATADAIDKLPDARAKANAFQTLARAWSVCGETRRAAECQRKAVELSKGVDGGVVDSLLLDFYEEAAVIDGE